MNQGNYPVPASPDRSLCKRAAATIPGTETSIQYSFHNYQNPGKEIEVSASYLKAFDTGRFLFPRELGREDFYVSHPRSWVDGFGDTEIYMLRFRYRKETKQNGRVYIDTRIAKIDAPPIDDARFNKYGLPSYYQLTFLKDLCL